MNFRSLYLRVPARRTLREPKGAIRRAGAAGLAAGAVVVALVAPMALGAGAGAATAGGATQLVITSAPFSARASTSATNAVTIKVENQRGAAVNATSALKIFLSSTSAGRIFSATSGGSPETSATLAANTSSIKVFYGDADAGTPTITASLTSPPSSAGLASGSQAETITAAATTTTLVANPSPGTFGSVATLTSTTTSGAGTPLGTVKFVDGSTTLCSGVATSGGTATCAVSTLAVAKHSLTAVFTSSSANFANSTSKSVTLNIGAASTSTTVSSSLNPTALGSTVVLSAVVTSAGGIPSGTVAFKVGSTVVCASVTLVAGTATCSTSALTLGTDALSGVFTSASGNFGGSTSAPATLSVTPAVTTTSLSASANPAVVGSAVTLTASVTSLAGVPSGAVVFEEGATVLCSGVALASGTATCSTSALALGTDALTASYLSPVSTYTNSSGSLSETITAGPGAALVITSAPFSASASLAATNAVTVTLEDALGNPTTSSSSTKIFLGGTSPGRRFSATSGGSSETFTTLPAGTSSVTFFYGDADAGTPTITASLTSPPSNTALASGSQTETITAAATTTVLTANPVPVSFGLLDTLTSTTTSAAGTPLGTVTFSDGSSVVCSSVATSGGVASCATSSLAAATHSLTAAFTPTSANFAASTSSPIVLSVAAASTTTVVTSSLSPAPYGAPVTFTSVVTSAGATPVGSVSFVAGSTTVCDSVPVTSGTATCTVSDLDAPSASIVATYTSSSANFSSSASPALTQVVAPSATTATLSSSDAGSSTWPSSPVESVLVTAASGPAPSGSVAFFENGSAVPGCGAVAFGPDSAAQCTLPQLDPASYTITATATPATADDLAASSNAVIETVGAAATTTSLSTSASSVTFAHSVTLSATELTAPGTVSFYDGSNALCIDVTLVAGTATCSTTALALGANALSAVTTTSSVDYAGSTSAPVNVSVNPGPAYALVITSAPLTAAPSTSPTNAVTVTLEDAYGNPTTSSTSTRIFISGSSSGKHISATAAGSAVASVILPAGASSVTFYYADTNAGSPTITVSLTNPPSNGGLLMGTQTETIT